MQAKLMAPGEPVTGRRRRFVIAALANANLGRHLQRSDPRIGLCANRVPVLTERTMAEPLIEFRGVSKHNIGFEQRTIDSFECHWC